MSYLNNDFFSYSFLNKLEKETISKEKKNSIENNLFYFFDILKDIPKNKSMSEKKYQEIIYNDAINEVLFENTRYINEIIEIYNNLNEKIMVLEFKKNVFPLNNKFEKYQDLKIINYGKENKFKFAILTDGIIWRIYKLNVANYVETFIEINIEDFVKSREIDFSISLLENFINQENLIVTEITQKSNLDIFCENSDLEIKKIEKELKSKMEDILSGIGLGFKEAIGKDEFSFEESKELYNDSITVLYRTLFIIYAEAKKLLPVDEEEYKIISFNKMIENLEFEVENNEFTVWEKMENLFSYIDKGYIGKNITIEAYNGGLFNNTDKKYLGNYSISNKNWIKVLKKIAFYEKGNKLVEKIEFKDLTTRSFGTLYEGILDYNMFIASEDMVKKIDKKGTKVSYIPLSKTTAKKTDIIIKKGEIYLSEDAFERKDTGAYYTPEPIVEYITSNTVDMKLDEILNKNKILREELDELKKRIDQEYDSFLKEALQEELYNKIISYIRTKVLTISVLDNAMGSGHFLVNAAYHIATKIYSFIHEYINFVIFELEDETYDFSYWLKKVVTHNIYGVDINNLAVQLGKLSLWLISASKDKPLSFLDHHLKCGNSLLGVTRKEIDATLGDNIDAKKSNNRTLFDITIDNLMLNLDIKFRKFEKMPEDTAQEIHNKERFYYEEIQKELEKLRIKWNIYLAMQLENKNGIVKKEEYDKIVNLEVEEIELAYPQFNSWKEIAKKNNFFHWELEFPDIFMKTQKGFDCIIGNPPYGANIDENVKEFYKLRYKKVHLRTVDTFNYYIENTIEILKDNEKLNFIVPNNLLYQNEYIKTREYLIKENKIENIINLGDKVFEANVPTCIFSLFKRKSFENYTYNYLDLRDFNLLTFDFYKNLKENYVEDLINTPSFIFGIDKVDLNIMKKVSEKSILLDDIVEEVASGISTGGDKIFRISEEQSEILNIEKSILKNVLVGREINKYKINYQNYKLIYTTKKIEEAAIPNTLNYLKQFEETLSKKRETKQGKIPYWSLHWPRYSELFEGEKIILRQTSDKIIATYDQENFYTLNSILVIKLDENKYYDYKVLLGILNSKLNNFIYQNLTQEKGRDFAEVKPKNIRKLMVPKLDEIDFQVIEELKFLVNLLLNEYIELNEFENIENKIDDIIYSIYNLTKEEIQYILERSK